MDTRGSLDGMGLERVNQSDMRFVLRVGTQCQQCMYFHCSDATDGERLPVISGDIIIIFVLLVLLFPTFRVDLLTEYYNIPEGGSMVDGWFSSSVSL